MRVSQHFKPQVRKMSRAFPTITRPYWQASCFLCHWTTWHRDWAEAVKTAEWHAKTMRHSDMRELKRRMDPDMAEMYKGRAHP